MQLGKSPHDSENAASPLVYYESPRSQAQGRLMSQDILNKTSHRIATRSPQCALRFSRLGYQKDGAITNLPLYLAARAKDFLSLRNLIAAKASGFFFAQTDADARAALVVVRLKHPPRLVQARDGCILRKGDVKRKLDLARAEE